MNLHTLLLELLLAFLQISNANLWTIVPGGKSGAIKATTTEADLKRTYGEQNVRDGQIHVGEGEFEAGTIVFPEDPMKRIELLWSDSEGKRFPKSVHIGGVRNAAFPNWSMWRTTFGISLGTTLSDLERINRRPF